MSKNSYQAVNSRREDLLRYLANHQNSSLSEISAYFQTSEITIRRDIGVLAEQGLVGKGCNGLYSLNCDWAFDSRYFLRYSSRHKSKAAIGKLALELVAPNSCLFLAGGTTVLEFSKHLSAVSPLFIITNNFYIPMYLSQHPDNVRVQFLEGNVDFPGMSTAGPRACETIVRYNADLAFFSADGLDPRGGASSGEVALNDVTRAMLAHARKRVLLIDSSKLNQTAIEKTADITEIDVIVTDSGAESSDLHKLRELVPTVLVAEE